MKTENSKLPLEPSTIEIAKPINNLVYNIFLAGALLGGGFLIYQLLKKRKKNKKEASLSENPKMPRMTTAQFINSMTMVLLEMAHQKLKSDAIKAADLKTIVE